MDNEFNKQNNQEPYQIKRVGMETNIIDSGRIQHIPTIEQNNQNNQSNNNYNFNIADMPENLFYQQNNPEIELNDFIINLEDSEKRSNTGTNKISHMSERNSGENIPSVNNPVFRGSSNQFAKTIVVISNTEEKKEEVVDIVQKCDSNNFVNIINQNMANTRTMNPRQKKPTLTSVPIMQENESILFFFVNPLAGVKEGQHLINMGVKKVEFTDNLHCTAYIYNMKDQANCEKGIEVLRTELNRISLIRVIIGGGDGSLLEMIEMLNNSGIDVNRCIFGVLPLGRSNDLSRALGWGDKMDISSDMAKFKLIIYDLADATSILVDVWEIKLTLDEKDGEIIEQGRDGTKRTLYDNKTKPVTVFKKSFINYFSLGFDARVGFGFNKSRSSCRCWNNCLYFCESMKKHCCRKPLPVNGFIDSFYTVKMDEENNFNHFNSNNDTMQNETMKENEAQKDLVFQTVNPNGMLVENNNMINLDNEVNQHNSNIQLSARNSNLRIGRNNYEKVVLKGAPVSLVCQNINYFIGGPGDVWRNSENNYGLEVYEPGMDKKDKQAVKNKLEKDKEIFKNVFRNADQKLNDQKLEFFTYESTWKLGCFKVTSGDADKVYHGPGPIIINFKDTPSKNEEDKHNRIYINIDGEYYHIVKPKELRVRLAKKFNGGKLKFVQKL